MGDKLGAKLDNKFKEQFVESLLSEDVTWKSYIHSIGYSLGKRENNLYKCKARL